MDRSRLALHKNAIKSLAKACATSEFPTCARCILRYCNVKQVFTSCSYGEVVADLISLLTPPESSPLADKLNGLCGSCLNVLSDDFVAEASAKIKASITENGYSESLENFQLLIHLPIILTLRNNYFQKTFNVNDGEIIGIKELFKVYLATKLSKLLGVKLNAESRFMIGNDSLLKRGSPCDHVLLIAYLHSCFSSTELTFTNPNGDKECDQLVDIVPDTFYQKKCRKSSAESFVNHSSVMRVISQLNGDSLSQLRLSNVAEKCILEDIALKNEAIYIAGRYLKYSRKLSQTPWIVDGGALFMSSVQERITGGVVRYIECKDIKFSSSGREDVDVRMLGRGRPFLLEVSNPRPSTNEQLMEKIKAFISESCEDVRVRDLQIVDKENCQKFLKEGEDSKTKTYQVSEPKDGSLANYHLPILVGSMLHQ